MPAHGRAALQVGALPTLQFRVKDKDQGPERAVVCARGDLNSYICFHVSKNHFACVENTCESLEALAKLEAKARNRLFGFMACHPEDSFSTERK